MLAHDEFRSLHVKQNSFWLFFSYLHDGFAKANLIEWSRWRILNDLEVQLRYGIRLLAERCTQFDWDLVDTFAANLDLVLAHLEKGDLSYLCLNRHIDLLIFENCTDVFYLLSDTVRLKPDLELIRLTADLLLLLVKVNNPVQFRLKNCTNYGVNHHTDWLVKVD